MCVPAQLTVGLAFASLLFEIFNLRGYLNIHNIFTLMTLFVGHLFLAVTADIFCRNGYEKFAWLVIVMGFLGFVLADRTMDSKMTPRRRR
jgi:hypothetical protein